MGRQEEKEFQLSLDEYGHLKKNRGRKISFFTTMLGVEKFSLVDLNSGCLSEPSGELQKILMSLSVPMNFLLQK